MDNVDTKCYFLDRCNISICRSILYVKLIKNDEFETENDNGLFEVVDDQRNDNGKNEICRDEYFNINMIELRGKPELIYEILPSYLHVMSVVNPNTITYLVTDEEKKIMVFFSLGASIEGFKAMRKVLDILTTNGAESINSALKTARTYLQIPLIDAIMMKICKWFIDHRKETGEGSFSQCLTPTVEKVLHESYQE